MARQVEIVAALRLGAYIHQTRKRCTAIRLSDSCRCGGTDEFFSVRGGDFWLIILEPGEARDISLGWHLRNH